MRSPDRVLDLCTALFPLINKFNALEYAILTKKKTVKYVTVSPLSETICTPNDLPMN